MSQTQISNGRPSHFWNIEKIYFHDIIVNLVVSLGPCGTIWCRIYGPTLIQVLAYSLMVTNLLIITEVQGHPSESTFTSDTQANNLLKIDWNLPNKNVIHISRDLRVKVHPVISGIYNAHHSELRLLRTNQANVVNDGALLSRTSTRSAAVF